MNEPAHDREAPEPLVTVVVPTLDEGPTIGPLLEGLREALSGVSHEVLVVDDGSTDGTPDKARQAHPRIRVVERPHERGLATAVVRGLREARGRYVLVMDGDGQHPPEATPRLVDAALTEDADLVVGSRRVDGGADEGLGPLRRLVSRGAETLATLALPTLREHGITDPMSGFFIVRRDALDLDELRPKGFKILLEILVRTDLDIVEEIPYRFRSRAGGESKLGLRSSLAFLTHLAVLAAAEASNRRVGAFGLVGASGVVVNLGALAALVEGFGVAPAFAVVAAVEVSILNNWFWNDVWTFRGRREGRWYTRLARFNAASIVTLGVNLSVFLSLHALGVTYLLAEGVAIGVSWISNYGLNLGWTYGDVRLPGIVAGLRRSSGEADQEAGGNRPEDEIVAVEERGAPSVAPLANEYAAPDEPEVEADEPEPLPWTR